MNDLKVIPPAGGQKDFVELFQNMSRNIRANKVVAAGYFICIESGEDIIESAGDCRAMLSALSTLTYDINKSRDDG